MDFGRAGGGVELLNEGVEEFEETVSGFLFKDDGAGEEAVTEAVAGGVEFAVDGDGALGESSVGSGGGDLFGCSHKEFLKIFSRKWTRIDAN